ncbi:hypothetical protein [uncultured Gammaproteobacteria bacterium]|nr:hypothetical protein [uncultured Gammaproteobacteria bacterium]
MESDIHPHVGFGDNDGFYHEIQRSNPDEDVSPSTDDSENNTTDTDNKKEIEMFLPLHGMSSASEEIAKIRFRIKQLEKKEIEMKEVKRMDEPDETQESTSEDEIGIKERVRRCISDMADDFGNRSDEVALRIIDEVYKELSSEDKNVVEDMLRGRLKANELFNYIRDNLSYVIHAPDIGELISNAKLVVWQQSRANNMETKGVDKEYAKGAGCEAIRDINDTSDKLVNIVCKSLKGEELEVANDMIKKEPHSNPIFTFIYKRVAYKVFNQDYGIDLEELTEDVRKFIRRHIKD